MGKADIITKITDWDGTMTLKGQDEMHPDLADFFDKYVGRRVELGIATGRFPYQLHVLGGERLRQILQANVTNPNNLHIYSGGATISDSADNIYFHEEHRLHSDQLLAIANLVNELRELRGEPFIVTQQAVYSVKTPTRWTNGETVMLYTNPMHITPVRDLMYRSKVPMPRKIEDIAKMLSKCNPAKVIIVSPKLGIGGEKFMSEVALKLAEYKLDVTGNHNDGIDIAPLGTNKASAIEKVLDMLDRHQIDIYAGDGVGKLGNDLCVFQAAHLVRRGVVVTNDKVHDLSLIQIPLEVVANAQQLAICLEKLLSES